MVKLRSGRLTAWITGGDLRGVTLAGHEVLRRVSYPVRDADWGTLPVDTLEEASSATTYQRRFAAVGGLFDGTFRVALAGEGGLRLTLRLEFRRAGVVNRAGLAVLHPIAGVAGEALTVRHPGGGVTDTAFPARIMPGQPARDIAGLAHRVGPVAVDMDFLGEVFEMEDQRNWSDASFKTYCRPLSLPRPFAVAEGEVVTQEIVLRLAVAAGSARATPARKGTARLPQVMLAHQPGLSTAAGLAAFPGMPVLLRMDADTPDAALAALGGAPVAAEIVVSDLSDLTRQIARLRAAGVVPLRVTALPASYLASHQPEGPWPTGPAPRDAIAPLRAALPGVPVGSGSLTHFTEYNRCPPDPSADFVTFGNSAIVHAADDASVLETLEALPAIFTSAKGLAPGKPMHLGLFSIAMRSNPYGRDVVPNPGLARLPMVMDDPRQPTAFAAAYALGVVAAAAEAGVESLALAMPDGPLGAAGTPLGALIRLLSAAAGQEVAWEIGPRIRLTGPGFALAAEGGTITGIEA